MNIVLVSLAQIFMYVIFMIFWVAGSMRYVSRFTGTRHGSDHCLEEEGRKVQTGSILSLIRIQGVNDRVKCRDPCVGCERTARSIMERSYFIGWLVVIFLLPDAVALIVYFIQGDYVIMADFLKE